MSQEFWIDGKCRLCKSHAIAKCDSCGLFACDGHSRKIKISQITLDICDDCFPSMKPGIKVAGVKLTKKSLEN